MILSYHQPLSSFYVLALVFEIVPLIEYPIFLFLECWKD
jgi:hypothetical protein